MAAINKCLALMNKSLDGGEATKNRNANKRISTGLRGPPVGCVKQVQRPSMTQSELSALVMNQCSRYGEPSTLRALIPFLLTAAPDTVPFVEAAAEAREEFYRANGIRPWRRQK